ncbi:MAG: HlyD family type I secretion periplasmic adaptor subunit, partial [Pseudomonadota bacterium]
MNVEVSPTMPASDDWTEIANPRRDIRAGMIVAALFFIVFLGWAALTRLDAAALAQGTLVVSGQR